MTSVSHIKVVRSSLCFQYSFVIEKFLIFVAIQFKLRRRHTEALAEEVGATKVDPTSLTLNLRHQSKLTGSNHSFPPNNRQNTTNLNFDYSGGRFSWLHFQTSSLPFRRKTPAYEFRNFVAHSSENQKKIRKRWDSNP